MEPFKNIFNSQYIDKLSEQLSQNYSSFKADEFKRLVPSLKKLELKDRVRLISHHLQINLPSDYKKAIAILIKSLHSPKNPNGIEGFTTWPLLQFIEDYGLDDFETSFKAMFEMTQRFSAEFAIRPFIKKDPDYCFSIFNQWVNHENEHIRRLCSEGTRPNLPWGMKVESIHNNLKRGIKLISKLKDDPSLYVRKSVANHLNDISRIDEELFIKTLHTWNTKKIKDERKWILRHATRTLLKKGHPEALAFHGYNPKLNIEYKAISFKPKSIKEGDKVKLNFKTKIQSPNEQEKVIMDYIIHYLKKDGSHSKKAFRFKDGEIETNAWNELSKEIHFKAVTTRKHYPGKHFISILINGIESKKLAFTLED